MPTPPGGDRDRRGGRRLALAMALILVATWAVVDEPFPKGAVLYSFTRKHGIDQGDLPAIAMYVVAGALLLDWLATPRP